MNEQRTALAESHPSHDFYAGLVCMGLLEIVLALTALLAAMKMQRTGGQTMLAPSATYAAAAMAFCWLGIGSILARRWARALTLITGWLWLVSGLIGLAGFVLMYPSVKNAGLHVYGARPVLFLALPLVLVLFYGSRNVKATFEERDPRLRWTDRCPLPVLGITVFELLAAMSLLATAVLHGALPGFGRIVSGAAALALAVVVAAMLAWAARGAYRVEPWGWWAAAAFWSVGAASLMVTVLHPFDWEELYRRMGFAARQLGTAGPSELGGPGQALWLWGISLVPWLLYLIWVRRFFAAGRDSRTC